MFNNKFPGKTFPELNLLLIKNFEVIQRNRPFIV